MALIRTNFFSEVLGMCMTADVILPQYASKEIGVDCVSQFQKHKTLWLLHGASDNHTAWQRRSSIERYAAPLGLAVVMPDVHLSSYADMTHGGKYYTYVSQELPQIMRAMFPLSEKREDNFIAGLSMGGAGCMKIGLANPENYAAIGCLSAGAINFRASDKQGNMSKERKERFLATYGVESREGLSGVEAVFESAKKILDNKLACPQIFHAIGKDDFLLDAAHETRDFFNAIEDNPFGYTYVEDEGEHTWEYWDAHIQDFLKFLKLQNSRVVRN